MVGMDQVVAPAEEIPVLRFHGRDEKGRFTEGEGAIIAQQRSAEVRGELPDPIIQARYEDLARRILAGETSLRSLARTYKVSQSEIRRWQEDERFITIYEDAKMRLYGDIDALLKDEKANGVMRRNAAYERATTVLAEVMETVREHNISFGANAKAAVLKVGVEAAEAIRRMVDTDRGMKQGGAPTFNVNIPGGKINVIQGAIKESGVDLSDIFDDIAKPTVIEAEVIDVQPVA